MMDGRTAEGPVVIRPSCPLTVHELGQKQDMLDSLCVYVS